MNLTFKCMDFIYDINCQMNLPHFFPQQDRPKIITALGNHL